MAKRSSGEQKPKGLTLLDLKETWFRLGEKQVNVEDATDAEFDQFIRQHIIVGWTLEDRRDALNMVLQRRATLGIEPEIIEENIQGKTQYHLIFKGVEPAPEANGD